MAFIPNEEKNETKTFYIEFNKTFLKSTYWKCTLCTMTYFGKIFYLKKIFDDLDKKKSRLKELKVRFATKRSYFDTNIHQNIVKQYLRHSRKEKVSQNFKPRQAALSCKHCRQTAMNIKKNSRNIVLMSPFSGLC